MKPISRLTDTAVEVFDAGLEPVRSFRVPPGTEGHAVSYAGDRLAYATGTAVVCAGPDGHELWRSATGRAEAPDRRRPAGCAWTPDDAVLWVYLPDVPEDRWLALDAATGATLIEHRLPTAGEGGEHFVTADGRHVLLCVGEGQDGVHIFRAGPGGELHTYGGTDRVLVALAPDDSHFMTVDQGQEDVAFHALADGAVEVRVPVGRFAAGPDDEVFLEWAGGYLDAGTAVAVVAGETDDGQEWWRHFRVAVDSGAVLGELMVATVDAYDLEPLGDGTFLVTDTDGTLRRLYSDPSG